MIKKKINNKKILFISIEFFDLEKEITKKLESFGASVTFYNERPNNSNFFKAIIRVKKSIYQNKINTYYKNILKSIDDKTFDYFFVNKGEVVPVFFMEAFQKLNPNCIKLFYCWDSFDNNPNALDILHFFDRKYIFDPLDAVNHKINFRPLFFLDDYANLEGGSETVDLLFLGTAHTDRYVISSKIKDWCGKNALSALCFYYMQGKFVYFYKRYFDKTFKHFDYKKLSFESLNKKQILDIYRRSKVILDINHPHQRGLTLRTFEALGASKKIITTNPEIKKFAFYNPNNILVIDRKNIQLNLEFFKSPYKKIQDKTLDKFSLEGFLYNIFIDPEVEYWNNYI